MPRITHQANAAGAPAKASASPRTQKAQARSPRRPRSREIFISLTAADTGIADAFSDAIRRLVGDAVEVMYSTSRQLDRSPRHGENWLTWIVDRVRNCDFALVLITPCSVEKPWILWEVGAVHGAAAATNVEGLRKVRPIIYQLDIDQIPSPIRSLNIQFRRGDHPDHVKLLFKDIVDEYRQMMTTDLLIEALEKLDSTVSDYLDKTQLVLVKAPLLEMADNYLNINAEKWQDRVKLKNEAAYRMGSYVITHRIPKEILADESHEGLVLALAAAIRSAPDCGDVHLLLKTVNRVERLHVKHKILAAMDELLERGYISGNLLPAVERALEKYALGADKQLLNRIQQTRYAIEVAGGNAD